jgi:hypothetical protein
MTRRRLKVPFRRDSRETRSRFGNTPWESGPASPGEGGGAASPVGSCGSRSRSPSKFPMLDRTKQAIRPPEPSRVGPADALRTCSTTSSPGERRAWPRGAGPGRLRQPVACGSAAARPVGEPVLAFSLVWLAAGSEL